MIRHFVVLASMLFLPAAQAANADDNDIFGLPLISLEGEIRFGSGRVASFKTFQDQPVVIRDDRRGEAFSFVAVRNLGTGDLEMKVSEGSDTSWKSLTFHGHSPMLGNDQLIFRRQSTSVTLKIGEDPVYASRRRAESELPTINPSLLKSGVCCVTCGLYTVCATVVVMSCGSCSAYEPENSYHE